MSVYIFVISMLTVATVCAAIGGAGLIIWTCVLVYQRMTVKPGRRDLGPKIRIFLDSGHENRLLIPREP